MLKVYVGPNEYSLTSSRDIDEGELAQRISKYKKDGICPCVKIVIEQDGLNILLQTAGCAKSGGATRPLNPREHDILELWGRSGLNDQDFSPGNLISFLKQVLRLLQ